MTEATAKKKGLKAFPTSFWLANLMELFERGAYYGMNSVLAVYLVKILKFDEQAVGVLQGFFYALTYILPIVGGALAERLGYRRMLMVAFSLLTIGYFATGLVTSYGLIFLFLLLVGTGSGLFKPIISGTIARTTTKENSGLGFGIYYWSINIGAFIAPLIVSWLKGFRWQYVFFASALWCFLMLIPTTFFYRDPSRPTNTKSIKEVISSALIVLRDSRFMLMIVIYSTFWIIYFQNFGTVLWYLRDFIYRAPVDRFMASIGIPFHFDAEHVTVINAGTIILLVVLVSRIVKKLKPLPVMAAGILIGSTGFLILALSQNPWYFILGIAVFSLGEMTAHPKYYSYVGLIAPKDRVAVYMGYAFLYGVIGSLVGSNLGAVLYEKILKPVTPPPELVASGASLPLETVKQIRFFWLLFAVLGFSTMIGMLIFNKYFSKDTPEANLKAWKIMLGLYVVLTGVGLYFFLYALFFTPQVQWKTMVQSFIMLSIGGGGIAISWKKPEV